MSSLTCPECRGVLKYDPKVKSYVCLSCGLMLSREEIDEIRQKSSQTKEDERAKRRKEYLKWWFSKK